VLLDQCEQELVLLLGPADSGLVGESSEPAVAHLGISAFDLRGNFFEPGILIAAKFQQKPILFFSPGFLGLFIALFLQVLPIENDFLIFIREILRILCLLPVKGKILSLDWNFRKSRL
jgi:hypothetical protein